MGDGLRGFGSRVTRAEAGAAGGQDEIDGVSIGDLAEECLDLRRIIRKKMRGGDGPVQLLATRYHGGCGSGLARCFGHGGTDNDDHDIYLMMALQRRKKENDYS